MHIFKRRNLFPFFLFALLFLSGIAGAEPRMTGVRDMTPEEEARIRPKMFRITQPQKMTKAALPSLVKNTAHLPVVTSQGQLGSCAAYATCYYMKTHQEAKEHGWVNPSPYVNPERIASPAWGYNIAQRVPAYGGDLAVSHYVVADYICEYGIASWAEMPYNPIYVEYDWDDWPTEAEWKRGIEWRGRQAGVIVIHTPEGVDALKEYLAGGDVAVITTHVYSNFDVYPYGEYTDNEVLYHYTTEGYRGGHALTVVGYDDNKEYFDSIEGLTKRGAFLCVNSWGTLWGVDEPTMGSKGFIWLPYDFFLQKKNGDPDALVIIDRVNYVPELFGIIGIDHTRGRKLLAKIYAGQKDYPGYPVQSPQWIKDALPVSNDYPLEDSRIVIDLTDYAHYENLAWYLEVFQIQMYAGTGDITYFAVQKGDNLPLVSVDTPMAAEINWYIWMKTGVFSDAGEILGGLHTRRGGIAWTDFNNDGISDFCVTGFDWKTGSAVPSTLLFINSGDGTLQEGVAGDLPQLGNSILASADYDNDGLPDIAIHGYIPGTGETVTELHRNNGDSTFSSVGITLPLENVNSLTWADYDNDGRVDLAVSTGSQTLNDTGQMVIYKNYGGGNFAVDVQPVPVSGNVAWADYDNDGWMDFIVGGRYKTAIYRNTGDGIFAETVSSFPPLRQMSAAWGDFDNDGYLDLALSGRLEDHTPYTAVYRNNGNGTFTLLDAPFTNIFCGSVAWGDINNDGCPDLVTTGRTEDEFTTRSLGNYPNRSIIYLNDGGGSFFNAFAEMPGVSAGDFVPVQCYTNTLALADYDMDGDIDIFLSGTGTYIYTVTSEQIYTGIQKSAVADFEGFNTPNSQPLPPSTLLKSAGWEDGAVTLEWTAGSDAETGEGGALLQSKGRFCFSGRRHCEFCKRFSGAGLHVSSHKTAASQRSFFRHLLLVCADNRCRHGGFRLECGELFYG